MNRASLFWGGLLFLIGVILLLDVLGLFPGLSVNMGGVIFSLLLIGLGVWLIWGLISGPKGEEVEQLSIPADGSKRAELALRHGAGRLSIAALPASDKLLDGTFGGGVISRVSRSGQVLRAELRMRTQGSWGFPSSWRSGSHLDWSLQLNKEIPLSIELSTGASESRIDLTELLVDRLDLRTGASSTDLALPQRAGLTRIVIRSGAASVSIRIPEGVAAQIRLRGGMMDAHVDRTRFPRRGSLYQSEGFDTAENKADIDVETGAGSIRIG